MEAPTSPLPALALTPPAGLPLLVANARAAQPGWASATASAREAAVIALAQRMVARRDEVLDLLHAETGRDPAEIVLSEVAFLVSYAKGAVAVARQALAPQRVRLSPIDYPGKRAVIERVPRGVVGVVAPWNYPLLQLIKPLFPALLAGNAVILKPSEHTPRTCAWLVEQCRACLPPDVVQAAYGDGQTGAALVEADLDAVVFTGSVSTGRKVAARCGERLIPCSVELGGKDAAIVLADCDLSRTVLGVLQWGFHNAGQDCSSIERVYVEAAIADRFVAKLAEAVGRLRLAPLPLADVGPMVLASQRAVVERHVADAVAHGATVVVGGERTAHPLGYAPTILDHCTDEMEVVREETFGPVLAIVRVQDADEAIQRVNASRYGLSASIWTRGLARGEALARTLVVGTVWINNHSFTGSVPQIPWTGTKDSGYGVVGSVFAYGTFARERTVVTDRSRAPDVFWRPVNADLLALGHAASALSLGSIGKLVDLVRLVRKRLASIRSLADGPSGVVRGDRPGG